MKILYIVLVACLVTLICGSCGEDNFSPERTRVFTIQSKVNGAAYCIRVALPDDYDSSDKKYPTIYVLDGDENFDFVANRCKEISDQHASQNALVICIGYGNDRSTDYTPTKISTTTGGGSEFLQFIKEELVPKIEQDFKADNDKNSRVILGHSYGGLFGAYVFAVDNELFGNYILLSPSLWFDNEITLEMEQQHRASNKDRHHLVFLGIGELENSGRMQAPFEALNESLGNNYGNVVLARNRENNLDHVGSKNPNITRGLQFYFQNR